MSYLGSLLSNVHEGLEAPTTTDITSLAKGVYDYFHYCCDGLDDTGWGCGYRTLQTICSWVLHSRKCPSVQKEVPSIPSIQRALVTIEDKPPQFENSREWIGSIEVGYVLSSLYDIDFRIIHLNQDEEWENTINILSDHFQRGGPPVMMGGKSDASSKCVVGTHGHSFLLIVVCDLILFTTLIDWLIPIIQGRPGLHLNYNNQAGSDGMVFLIFVIFPLIFIIFVFPK